MCAILPCTKTPDFGSARQIMHLSDSDETLLCLCRGFFFSTKLSSMSVECFECFSLLWLISSGKVKDTSLKVFEGEAIKDSFGITIISLSSSRLNFLSFLDFNLSRLRFGQGRKKSLRTKTENCIRNFKYQKDDKI